MPAGQFSGPAKLDELMSGDLGVCRRSTVARAGHPSRDSWGLPMMRVGPNSRCPETLLNVAILGLRVGLRALALGIAQVR